MSRCIVYKQQGAETAQYGLEIIFNISLTTIKCNKCIYNVRSRNVVIDSPVNSIIFNVLWRTCSLDGNDLPHFQSENTVSNSFPRGVDQIAKTIMRRLSLSKSSTPNANTEFLQLTFILIGNRPLHSRLLGDLTFEQRGWR